MHTPGFGAEASVYRGKGHYLAASGPGRYDGAAPQQVGYRVSDTVLPNLPNFCSPPFCTPGSRIDQDIGYHPEAYAADTRQAVLPMSVPGHVSAPGLSSQCNTCTTLCAAAAQAGFDAAVIGCLALAWIPFVGGVAYAACVATAAGVAYVAANICTSNCQNVGSPCCPIPCGPEPYCCFEGETCLDSGLGLCCPFGTAPCYGTGAPAESCYSLLTEKCLPSGPCSNQQVCGENCCSVFGETCIDGNCVSACLPGQTTCGTQCCNEATEQCIDNNCCPNPRACGEICCPPGLVCDPTNPNVPCVVPPPCPAGEYLCISADHTTQTCCAEDEDCCDDGLCCGGSASPFGGFTCQGFPSVCSPPPK